MKRAWKKYDTTYKKRADVHSDTFLPRRAPKGVLRCAGCGAVFHRRRWSLAASPKDGAAPGTRPVYCPACRKIKQHSVSGVVSLTGVGRREAAAILRLLRNEEARAREKNPLGRVMRVSETKEGWTLETTTEKLAQRLGRALGKARGGSVDYAWSHNNKFVRVTWTRPAAAPRASLRK